MLFTSVLFGQLARGTPRRKVQAEGTVDVEASAHGHEGHFGTEDPLRHTGSKAWLAAPERAWELPIVGDG